MLLFLFCQVIHRQHPRDPKSDLQLLLPLISFVRVGSFKRFIRVFVLKLQAKLIVGSW